MNFPDLPHLKQLQKDIWQWPKSRAAVMVGAGFSLNAEPLPGVSTRFPTWRQLVRAMFDELHPPLPGMTAEQVKAREDRFNMSNALRIASEYEAAFDRRKLELLIRIQNPDSDHRPGRLHQLLLDLPWTDVFTTNYDTLLERTEVLGRNYQPVIKSSEMTSAFAPRIVKLHGSFPSQTPFIISEEDYRTYPRLFAPFVNTVQQSLLENSFVLVGFSGDDPNFLAWTGWIRDELGGKHAPIYLVGPLSLGNAERSLLARRGVTPIDLSPVFAGFQPPQGVHAASIEWFLESLAAARPPRPEKWPDQDQALVAKPENLPPLIHASIVVPESVRLSPSALGELESEDVEKVLIRWQQERLEYPGWLVPVEGKRTQLWSATKHWTRALTNATKDWPPVDRLLLFREINWRFETSMVPLFPEVAKPFQRAVDESFEIFAEGKSVTPLHGFLVREGATRSNCADAWLEIAFGLLREARETYSTDTWNDLKIKIDNVVKRNPHHTDRNNYENALWAMWNVERNKAKDIVSRWQPSSQSPLAAMWKAGLLAELDERGEARTILRTALNEIRRGIRSHGQNILLLSLEGWCTYLIFVVEVSLDIRNHFVALNEFSGRWQELKAWDCSPWPHKEALENALAGPPSKPQRAREEVRGFDPGDVSVTYHLIGGQIEPYLPGFAYIRFFEQVGIPLHLQMLEISGDALKSACSLIAPFIGFWSPALLIRAVKVKALTEGPFLNRVEVATMDPTLAQRIYSWCLEIFEREINSLSGYITVGSVQESLLGILPEVLSRLAFKVSSVELQKTFPLVLQVHRHPAIRSNRRLHDSCTHWFKRMFHASDGALLLEWLPDLIRGSLFDESMHPMLPADQLWPDPMQHFPSERGREARDTHGELVPKIIESTDWLLRRAASEVGEGRRRAIDRLVNIYHAGIMTEDQQRQFGELLWSQLTADHLPDRPGFAVYGFLHLPAPVGVDVVSAVKTRIMNLPSDGVVTQVDGKINISTRWTEEPLIFEASFATKPVVQILNESLGKIEWNPEESKQLYFKAWRWWENDKLALERGGRMGPFSSFGTESIHNTLKLLGLFMARVILPKADWAGEDEWQQLIAWLQDVRQYGAYPTMALPYILIKRPSEAGAIAATILSDLKLDAKPVVIAAARAVRHWVHLAAAGLVPESPSSFIDAIVERVIFRRRAGISGCLLELACLVTEKPEVFSPSHIALLTASLVPWHNATMLSMPDGEISEFHEAERPDIRSFVAMLAGSLRSLNLKAGLETPEPPEINLWEEMCASDPLPEIKRAFYRFGSRQHDDVIPAVDGEG